MKYYNSALTDAPVTRIVEVHNEYYYYLESIRAHIPEALYFLANDVNFGDYGIELWSIDPAAQTLHLRIRGEMIANQYDVRWFAITFSGVSDFRFENGQSKGPEFTCCKTLEVGNTEAELIDADKKLFEFRWGFVEGSEMAIRFRGIECVYLELPEPERTSVRSGILYAEGTGAFGKEDYLAAATKFAEALELTPNDTALKFLLAKAKYYLCDLETAKRLLLDILEEKPRHRGALLYQVLVLEATQQWYEILLLCTKEVREISGEVELIYVAALCHIGNREEAWIAYRAINHRILNRNPRLRKEVLALLHAV